MPRKKYKPLNSMGLEELYDLRASHHRELEKIKKDCERLQRKAINGEPISKGGKPITPTDFSRVVRGFYLRSNTIEKQIKLVEAQVKSKQDEELLRAYEQSSPREAKKTGRQRSSRG